MAAASLRSATFTPSTHAPSACVSRGRRLRVLGNQTPSTLRTGRLVQASPADGAKSPSCKTASWEKGKNEVAGRGHGATGAQYAHNVHAASGKNEKRVQASALVSCEPVLGSLNKQHTERQSAGAVCSRHGQSYARAASSSQGAAVTDSLIWWDLYLLITAGCRALNASL